MLLDEVIYTDYGQLDLSWGEDGYFDGDFDRSYKWQVNGLVGAAHPTGVHINLARRSGGSPVRMVLLDAPPRSKAGQWEDVVEVSITVPDGQDVVWSAWVDMGRGPLKLLLGSYRLRVSAKGRDEGHLGELADGAVDDYLIQFWPARWRPDAILRTGSENAKYWHREVGGRRPL